jgi:hypothetical protein
MRMSLAALLLTLAWISPSFADCDQVDRGELNDALVYRSGTGLQNHTIMPAPFQIGQMLHRLGDRLGIAEIVLLPL